MALDAFLRQRLRSSKATPSPTARVTGARPWLSAVFGGLVAWGTALAGIGVVDLIVREILLEDLRTNLARTAAFTAALIDAGSLAQFDRPELDGTPDYNRAAKPLQDLLRNNPDIRFAYVGVTDGSTMHFVLDGTPIGARDASGKLLHSAPMEVDDPTTGEQEVAQTRRLTVEKEPSASDWGMGIRAQAPITDGNGTMIAYVGITMSADRYAQLIHRIDVSAAIGIALAGIIAFLNGLAIWQVQRSKQAAIAAEMQTQANLSRAYELANLGTWRADIRTRVGSMSEGMAHLIGAPQHVKRRSMPISPRRIRRTGRSSNRCLRTFAAPEPHTPSIIDSISTAASNTCARPSARSAMRILRPTRPAPEAAARSKASCSI
jgi:hypothetical protein